MEAQQDKGTGETSWSIRDMGRNRYDRGYKKGEGHKSWVTKVQKGAEKKLYLLEIHKIT